MEATDMLGKWNDHYKGVQTPVPYGNSASYRLGSDWLSECSKVEDWGCGLGWFRRFLKPDQEYLGIDGSWSHFADVICDLAHYTSDTLGLFMRHVLEHNYQWDKVLQNALASFTERMVLVMFTPWGEKDHVTELRFEEDYGVPTLGFGREAITKPLIAAGLDYVEYDIQSPETFYGVEHLFMIEKP